MKIIVSSKNPVKINATLQGFESMFAGEKLEIEGISVPSGVADQPMSEKETILGALNRVKNAKRERTDADFYVGIEGGIEVIDGEMLAFAWVVIEGEKIVGKGRTASFYLPQRISDLITQGKELGEADDIVFGKTNSKQENGSVGILTRDVITRTTLYVPAVIMALIPFKNKELFTKPI